MSYVCPGAKMVCTKVCHFFRTSTLVIFLCQCIGIDISRYPKMGYNTASTEWPGEQFSTKIRHLVDRLFATLDDSSEGAGDRLAEIFAPDGEFAGSHAAKGTEGIHIRCSPH